MNWYHWILLASLAIFLVFAVNQIIRFMRLASPPDFAPGTGRTGKAVAYSFTGAMNPAKKESAFFHLPTYIGGLIYHLGTFLAFGLSIFILSGLPISAEILIFPAGFLVITGCFGTAILIKRILNPGLRSLSSPDDYFSNILVTLFQLLTALVLFFKEVTPAWYIMTGLLLIYIPVSKLKHLFYFFLARYYLGRYFGKRGVWPPNFNHPK